MDSKAMGIKRLDHVAWVVNKLDDALPLLTKLMGMTIEGRFENPEVGFRGVGLRVPGGTGHFELLEPYDENSYLHKFIAENGPGLHHVTFEVEDAHAAAKAMKDFGIELRHRDAVCFLLVLLPDMPSFGQGTWLNVLFKAGLEGFLVQTWIDLVFAHLQACL